MFIYTQLYIYIYTYIYIYIYLQLYTYIYTYLYTVFLLVRYEWLPFTTSLILEHKAGPQIYKCIYIYIY